MRILILSPYPPYPPRSGGALRIYNLLRGLAERHDVWCLTFAPDMAAVAALKPMRNYCRVLPVQGVPPRHPLQRAWTTATSTLPDMAHRNASCAYTNALAQLLRAEQFDIIHAASIEMARYGLPLAAATPRPAGLVLDEFNAEYVLQRRAALTDLTNLRRLSGPGQQRALLAAPYSLVQWGKLAAYERHLLHQYDRVLVVSTEDRHALQRLAPQAPTPPIIPNGVDSNYFNSAELPTVATSTDPTLVFTGSLDFRPNIDALHWFVAEVFPLIREQRPAVRLLIVGRSPGPAVWSLHNGQSVVVQPDVPDVRPAIAAAAVYLVPMRIGGGVRLKLLEALSMQAAVVSTTLGAEGVPELRAGAHLLLADKPQAFADAVLRLLDDPALREQLGIAGRALVCEHYDWRVIVPRLEAVYQTLRH